MTDWLLGTLLATSALVVLVLVVREPVRRRFGSRVTYGLWLIPAARLLMPTLTTTVERTVPAEPPLPPLIHPAAGEPLLLSKVAGPEPSFLAQLGGWPTVVLSIWLAVAAVLFLSRMIAFHRDRRAILASSTEIAGFGSVRVVSSPEILSPVAFGILDRVIAVPADFDRMYGAHERRLALEHELAHHKSGDLVANLFAFVLLCLQWFNPLAWVAHAAFRFDQEAACDSRVLDKGNTRDRADYGRAIAKAASGRALLFASALDRRNTLQRRLQSMLRSSNPTQRLAGRLLVGIAIAVALPLTASRAIDYVDLPAPPAPALAPLIADAPALAPVTAEAAAAPAADASLAAPVPDEGTMLLNEDSVTINGKTKRWEELTPAEKSRVRAAIAKAREGLSKAHFDRERVTREVGEAVAKARINSDELQQDLAAKKANVAEAMRRLDEHEAELRRAGQNPEEIKAQVRAALQSVDSIDVEAIRREALAAIDQDKIAASLAKAEESMRKAQAELDRLDARMRDDQH